MIKTIAAPCPACGYAPDAEYKPVSDLELRKKNILDRFTVHMQQSWWITQPIEICRWLKEVGIRPKFILDAGCGDGRWLSGIYEAWPDVDYVGIDKIKEHIALNKENLPKENWVLGNLITYEAPIAVIDLVLIAGTFNPLMPAKDQGLFLGKVLEIAPRYIVCLFDLKQTGCSPDQWICPRYQKRDVLEIQPEYQSPRQKLVVWLYERVQ